MMPSYYTPPPSAGTHWSPSQSQLLPDHNSPHFHAQQPNAQLPHSSQANAQNSMFAMMAMMQQLQQNYTHNVPQQQHQQQQQQVPQTQQQQPSTPVHEQPKMTTPQPSDNELLAQVLYKQTNRGLTYKAALESLHGHNGIMAFAWKDYFLENKQTIDALVDQISGRASSTSSVPIKQQSSSPPMVNSSRDSQNDEQKKTISRSHSQPQMNPQLKLRIPQERSASVSRKDKAKERTPIRVAEKKKEKAANRKSKSITKEDEPASSRRTLNSMSSAPSIDLLAKIPPAVAIDKYTGLPAAPSRSPSPPPAAPNSRYTEQDAIFFFRRIAYDLARDPDLSKARLCELLGDKAPHHSALSWRSYWHKHEDVADKMYLLTQLDEEDREEAIQSWKSSVSVGEPRSRSVARKVTYRESSDSEALEEDSLTSDPEEDSESSGDDDDDDDEAPGSTDEDEVLGELGSPFTMAETRALAKHIASVPEWFKGRKEWESFCSAHPQRTNAAWREYYRRKGGEIDSLAKKYINKAKRKESINAQRGRPSWARQSQPTARTSATPTTMIANATKRKLSEDNSREPSEDKRTKVEDLN